MLKNTSAKTAVFFLALALVSAGIFTFIQVRFHTTHQFPDGTMYGPYLGAVSPQNSSEVRIAPPVERTTQKYGIYYSFPDGQSRDPYFVAIHDIATDTELGYANLNNEQPSETIEVNGKTQERAWVLADMAISPDGTTVYVRFISSDEAAINVYSISDGGSLTFIRTFRTDSCPTHSGYLFANSDSLTVVNAFPRLAYGEEEDIFGCRISAVDGTLERSFATFHADGPYFSTYIATQDLRAYHDVTTGNIYVVTVQSFSESAFDTQYITAIGILRPNGPVVQILYQSTERYSLNGSNLIVNDHGVYALNEGTIIGLDPNSSSGRAFLTVNIGKLTDTSRPIGMVPTADGQYIWTGYRAEDRDTFILYPNDFSRQLTTITGRSATTASMDTSATGHTVVVGMSEGGLVMVVDPSTPRNHSPLWWIPLWAAIFFLVCAPAAWMLARRSTSEGHVSWVGRGWVALCVLVTFVSVGLLLSPFFGGWVTHKLDDGTTYGPYRGDITSAPDLEVLDPNHVNQVYGLMYTLPDDMWYWLEIIDTSSKKVVTTVREFGSEMDIQGNERLQDLAVSDKGDMLFVSTYSQVGVYAISNEGLSLTYVTSYQLPDYCDADKIFADPDGSTLVTLSNEKYANPGSYTQCRVNAMTGELVGRITWDQDSSNGKLDSILRDPHTGDIYSLMDTDSALDLLSVLRAGSNTIEALPLATTEEGLCPCWTNTASMVIDNDSVYVVFGKAVYRYSTADPHASPVLVWKESDSDTWIPTSLVRTSDKQHWWIIEEGLWYKGHYGYRYTLYSDSFSRLVMPMEDPLSTFGFYPGPDACSLLIVRSHQKLDLVDTSLPRPFSDRWNWWYAGFSAGFALLTWLSFRGVKKHEDHVASERRWKKARDLYKQEWLDSQKKNPDASDSSVKTPPHERIDH